MAPRNRREVPDLSGEEDDAVVTEAVSSSPGTRQLVRRFTLTVIGGPDEGARLSGSGGVVIGTHRSADFQLTDRALSRFHCQIDVEDGQVVLRDLDSRNGTRVGGVPVLAAPIESGSVVTAGRSRIRFELGARTAQANLSERDRFGVAAGESAAIRAVFAILERAAETDATLLLRGETGTGKDILAESLHRESRRSGGPFVVVDCGALPRSLLEAELFGHEEGAFTGAGRARRGAFEAASGGTLFLDEIGELDIELQPKLLGALERRRVTRLGSSIARPLDVRVVAATSRNLRRDINAGRFRPDLYYRVAVLEAVVPPLRQRQDDLPILVTALLDQMRVPPGRAGELASKSFVAALARHQWPGNVRELRNYLERCLAMGDAAPPPGAGVPPGPPAIDGSQPYRTAKKRWVDYFERSYLEDLLARHGDNVSAAARASGIDRMHLYRLLWRCGLR